MKCFYLLMNSSFAGPLKWLITHFYLYLIIPVLNFVFRKTTYSVVNVVPRHSVTNKEDFVPFWSDLDYSITTLNTVGLSELEQLNGLALALKKKLPFLDYPEIYSMNEIKLMNYLIRDKDFMCLWSFIYNVRKLGWELKKKETVKRAYHSLKNQGSIKKLYKRIFLSGEKEGEQNHIDFIRTRFYDKLWKHHEKLKIPRGVLPTYSNYLGCTINQMDSDFSLLISSGCLISLFACIPEGVNLYYDFYQGLRHHNQDFARYYLKSCLMELLSCNSVQRTLGSSHLAFLDKRKHHQHITYLKKEITDILSWVSLVEVEKAMIKDVLQY